MEIDRQLRNKKSEYLNQLEAELNTKLLSGCILNERKIVIQLLGNDLSESSETIRLQARICTVEALILLGGLTELSEPMPTQTNNQPQSSPLTDKISPGRVLQEVRLACGTMHCFFCYWDLESDRTFSTRYKARNHVERYHLHGYDKATAIRCPSPSCGHKNTSGVTAFKNHLAIEHSYDVFAHRFVEFAPDETVSRS